MKIKLLSIVLIFTVIDAYSQQDAQFTQYMYNTININPAYAGSRGILSIFGLYRTQWVGLDGAPETSSFSVNTPINNSNLGVGLSLVNDKIGPTNENNFSVDVSYTVQTSASFKLSFGIKGTANFSILISTNLTPKTREIRSSRIWIINSRQISEPVFIGILIRLMWDYRFLIL
jgi:type IX secretion system PorP/SprF family membrane protein